MDLSINLFTLLSDLTSIKFHVKARGIIDFRLSAVRYRKNEKEGRRKRIKNEGKKKRIKNSRTSDAGSQH